MTSNEILILFKSYKWHNLNRIYGCAHSSIIGFIAYEWLNYSEKNTIIDGPPSPAIGNGGRIGKRYSDLLLCKNSTPFCSVEVETQVTKYTSKFDALIEYKNCFDTIEFGLFYLSNLKVGKDNYKHSWDEIKELSSETKFPVALLSAEKQKLKFDVESEWTKLLNRNNYSRWETLNIDYWIFDGINKPIEGSLWNNGK